MTVGTLLCRWELAAAPPVTDAFKGPGPSRGGHTAAVGGAVGGTVLSVTAGAGHFCACCIPGILGQVCGGRPAMTIIAGIDSVVGRLMQTVHGHIVRCGRRHPIDKRHLEVEVGGLAAHGGIVGIGLMTDAAVGSQPGP